MTTDQAILRLERKAAELQAKGYGEAAYDWRKDASNLRRLVGLAQSLPPARATRAKP